MDSDLSFIIPIIANGVGVSPSSFLAYLGVIILVARLVSRLIPDDATGPLSIVRKVAAFISVDVSNRLTKGVSQTDVTKKLVGLAVEKKVEDVITDAASKAEALIPEVVQDSSIVPPFPGLKREDM